LTNYNRARLDRKVCDEVALLEGKRRAIIAFVMAISKLYGAYRKRLHKKSEEMPLFQKKIIRPSNEPIHDLLRFNNRRNGKGVNFIKVILFLHPRDSQAI